MIFTEYHGFEKEHIKLIFGVMLRFKMIRPPRKKEQYIVKLSSLFKK